MGDGYRPYEIDLKLPRFETSSDTNDLSIGLIGLLQQMGIHLAFDSDFAEIPNMCETAGVYISMMRQKAKIKVNEEGSEAAAVTIASAIELTSLRPNPPVYPKAEFHANKSFVYVISERSSGVILFVGKFTGQ
jgi:serpin B